MALKSLKKIFRHYLHKFDFFSILLLTHHDQHDDLLECEDNNLYKRDLLRAMTIIDEHESSMIGTGGVNFVDSIKKLGLIIYMAGPAISRISSELVNPLVNLYDNHGLYGKDVKIATLSVLSTMLSQSIEHQELACKYELHMALLDDLETLCFGVNDLDGADSVLSKQDSVMSNYLGYQINPFKKSVSRISNTSQMGRPSGKRKLKDVKGSLLSWGWVGLG